MNTIKRMFQLNLCAREVTVAKRIMAVVMLPILMFYMTSVNILLMGMMKANAADEVVAEVVKEVAPAPKEEPKTPAPAPKEPARNASQSDAGGEPKVEEKIVPEIKTEVKTKEPKVPDSAPAVVPVSVAEVAPVIVPANETQNNAVPTETVAGGGSSRRNTAN